MSTRVIAPAFIPPCRDKDGHVWRTQDTAEAHDAIYHFQHCISRGCRAFRTYVDRFPPFRRD